MRLLLDTHILLWALDTPERLSDGLRERLESPANEVCFSVASIWEIAIKTALGKVNFCYSPEEIAQGARSTGFAEIAISADHASRVARLPHHHGDPFDRLLIAQAQALPARLLTADTIFAAYSELVEIVG